MIDINSINSYTIEYSEPKIDLEEIRRYAGIRVRQTEKDIKKPTDNILQDTDNIMDVDSFMNNDSLIYIDNLITESLTGIENLIAESLKEALPLISYKICYRILDLDGDKNSNFGSNEKLATELRKLEYFNNIDKVVVFGATIGLDMDRLIAKYGKVQPSKALIMQAIGAERIESLCDAFEDELKDVKAKKRVSPGYGKFDLKFQNDIFSFLDLSKNIGIYLNESLLMSPSKSVTAVIPLGCKKDDIQSGCTNCNKLDCEYRR